MSTTARWLIQQIGKTEPKRRKGIPVEVLLMFLAGLCLGWFLGVFAAMLFSW